VLFGYNYGRVAAFEEGKVCTRQKLNGAEIS